MLLFRCRAIDFSYVVGTPRITHNFFFHRFSKVKRTAFQTTHINPFFAPHLVGTSHSTYQELVFFTACFTHQYDHHQYHHHHHQRILSNHTCIIESWLAHFTSSFFSSPSVRLFRPSLLSSHLLHPESHRPRWLHGDRRHLAIKRIIIRRRII